MNFHCICSELSLCVAVLCGMCCCHDFYVLIMDRQALELSSLVTEDSDLAVLKSLDCSTNLWKDLPNNFLDNTSS